MLENPNQTKPWYDTPAEFEKEVIRKKREEWFPEAEIKDWEILKHLYHMVDIKKRNVLIPMREAVALFTPSVTSSVKAFCRKFHRNIISIPDDMQYVHIGSFGYRVLTDETFKDIRESQYWLQYLEKVLLENQTDYRTVKTDFPEEDLRKRLISFKSEEAKLSSIPGEIKVNRIRQPEIESFAISEIAYYSRVDNEIQIGLQKGQIWGQDPQEWFSNFFKSRFEIFEPKQEIEKEVIKPAEKTAKEKINKIFISCGQHHDHERALGNRLVELVDELTPFKGYFAENQTTLSGLTNNIFKELNNSSGLIVVMHKRGELTTPGGDNIIRASIWIEQEVAIAAFIQTTQQREIEVVLFLEDGISLEGVRKYLQLNPITFKSSSDIEAKFKKMLSNGKFNSSSLSPINRKSRVSAINTYLNDLLAEVDNLLKSNVFNYSMVSEIHEKTMKAVRAALGKSEMAKLLSFPGIVPNSNRDSLQTSLVRHREYLNSTIGKVFSDDLLETFEAKELEEI